MQNTKNFKTLGLINLIQIYEKLANVIEEKMKKNVMH